MAGPATGYVLFILPLLLIGAGFVVATTVRTAIIFASVPRGLPATAAALNEASLAVGTRLGIVLVTAIVAAVALSTYDASVTGLPPEATTVARQRFADVLFAVGTPSFPALARAVQPDLVIGYVDAYVAGVRTALFLGGAAAMLAGIVAWFGLGRRDPLATPRHRRDGLGLRAPRRARHRGAVTDTRPMSDPEARPLRVDRVPLEDRPGELVVLTLDRPAAMNAIDNDLLATLHAALAGSRRHRTCAASSSRQPGSAPSARAWTSRSGPGSPTTTCARNGRGSSG